MGDRRARGLVARRHEQHEERGQLLLGQFLRSISAFTSALVMSSMGLSIRYLPSSSMIPVSCRAGVEEHEDRVLALGDELGVAVGEDDVRVVQDGRVLTRRHAHHVADDLERERRGDVGDEVARAACLRTRR